MSSIKKKKIYHKPLTNQNKPNQKLEKIEKNDFCLFESYGRNFWRAPEISAENENLAIGSQHIFNISTGFN